MTVEQVRGRRRRQKPEKGARTTPEQHQAPGGEKQGDGEPHRPEFAQQARAKIRKLAADELRLGIKIDPVLPAGHMVHETG